MTFEKTEKSCPRSLVGLDGTSPTLEGPAGPDYPRLRGSIIDPTAVSSLEARRSRAWTVGLKVPSSLSSDGTEQSFLIYSRGAEACRGAFFKKSVKAEKQEKRKRVASRIVGLDAEHPLTLEGLSKARLTLGERRGRRPLRGQLLL